MKAKTLGKILRGLIFALLLLTASLSLTDTPAAGAIPPRLVKLADLPGGDIMDIEFALGNPNVVYLASNTNNMGIWRSDDAGETWRNVFNDNANPGGPVHTNDIAVQPDNPDVLLAEGHGLFKLVMVEGALLRHRDTPQGWPSGGAVGFSPSVPTLAYAADGNGNISKSPDGGDTWETVARLESGHIFSLVVDPQSEAKLYAGTETGVYKSTDAGQKWKQVLANGTFDLAIAPGDSNLIFAAGGSGIFKSPDGGTTWRRTLDRHAYSVGVAQSDSRVIYAGTPEGVFKSSDGGEVWVLRDTGMDYPNVGPLAVHPKDPNTVIAGSNINLWTWYGGPFPISTEGEGIYKTTDGGLSWVRKGEREFVDVDVIEVAVDPNNPNIVYSGTFCSRGIYRSEDGGASWTVINGGLAGRERVRDLAHYTMRIVTAGSVLWLTSQGGIIWSTDGGRTWQPPGTLAQPPGGRHYHGIAISPQDANVIFVGTVGYDPPGTTYYLGARILRSTDGGLSWQEVGAGFPSGSDTGIEDIAFDPINPKVVYVATSSHHHGRTNLDVSVTVGIYKSTDGGDSWMPVNTGLANQDVSSIAVSPSKAGLVYAGTAGGVFRSFDGGATWAALSLTEHVFRLLIDPADPRSIYAGTETGLFWSPDEGDSWQRLESVPAKHVTGLAMDANGQVLYAAVNLVGVFKGVLRDISPPSILSLVIEPAEPTVEDSVQVTASVMDNVSSVERVALIYTRLVRGQEFEVSDEMALLGRTFYQGVIPQQPSGTTVRFRIEASDGFGNIAVTPTQSYTVKRPTYFTELEREFSLLRNDVDSLRVNVTVLATDLISVKKELLDAQLSLNETQSALASAESQFRTFSTIYLPTAVAVPSIVAAILAALLLRRKK